MSFERIARLLDAIRSEVEPIREDMEMKSVTRSKTRRRRKST